MVRARLSAEAALLLTTEAALAAETALLLVATALLLAVATAATAVLLTAAVLTVLATLHHLVQHALGLVDRLLRAAQRACTLRGAVAVRCDADLASGLHLEALDLLATTANH